MFMHRRLITVFTGLALLGSAVATTRQARADIVLGAAGNYTVISETGVPDIKLSSNVTVNGNIGIVHASNAQLKNDNTSVVNGNVDFAGTANVQTSANVHGTVTSNVDLSAAKSAIETLSTSSNTNASGAPTQNLTNASNNTININTGQYNAATNTYYFNIGSVNLSGNGVLTISGDSTGANVVFNTSNNLTLNGGFFLTGGLTATQVLFNVAGTNKSLTVSAGGDTIPAILLDPNGTITVTNTAVYGAVYGGGSSELTIQTNSVVIAPAPAGVPEPSALAGACLVTATGLGYSWHRRRRRAATA
jgi:hypothetical protein